MTGVIVTVGALDAGLFKNAFVVIISLLFSAIGVVLGFIAFQLLRTSFKKLAAWKTAGGVITGYVEFNKDKRPFFVPQAKFVTEQGKTITFSGSVASMRKSYPIGAAIRVLYPPDSPNSAVIKSFASLFSFAPVVLLSAAVFLWIGLYQIPITFFK